jgi:hypothetical protein
LITLGDKLTGGNRVFDIATRHSQSTRWLG